MKGFEQFKKSARFLSIFILDCFLTAAYWYVWQNQYNIFFKHPFRGKGSIFTIAAYLAVLLFFSLAVSLHKIDERRMGENVFSGVITVAFVNAIAFVEISLIGAKLARILPLFLLSAAQSAVIVVWALMASELMKKLNPPQKMIIVYGSHLATELVFKMSKMVEKYTICESVNIADGLDEVAEKLKRYASVIICDVPAQTRNDLLKYCYENRKKTYIVPKISDILIRGSTDITYFDCPLLCCESVGLSLEQKIIKRIMDIAVSLVMIIVFSPILLTVSAAIKLYDRGPVFYKQRRVTIDGREFDIIKFRSMIIDAEPDGKSKPAVTGDERVTPIGRLIRPWRIDELPQIFNILLGEMSVVGPRSERVEHVVKYSEKMPEFMYRHKVKTGLTGYAQVFGKYNTTAYDKLKLDLMYIQNYSVLMDIKLILMTVKIMFKKESTEGFDQYEGRGNRDGF